MLLGDNHWKALEFFNTNMIEWDRCLINMSRLDRHRMFGKMMMSKSLKGLRFCSTCKRTWCLSASFSHIGKGQETPGPEGEKKNSLVHRNCNSQYYLCLFPEPWFPMGPEKRAEWIPERKPTYITREDIWGWDTWPSYNGQSLPASSRRTLPLFCWNMSSTISLSSEAVCYKTSLEGCLEKGLWLLCS